MKSIGKYGTRRDLNRKKNHGRCKMNETGLFSGKKSMVISVLFTCTRTEQKETEKSSSIQDRYQTSGLGSIQKEVCLSS